MVNFLALEYRDDGEKTGGWVLRIAPNDDPIVWLVVFLFGCAFACFWAELIRD